MNIYHKQITYPDATINIVLLHGWGSSSDIWQTWLGCLNEQYNITLIDLPGLGRSLGRLDDNASLEGLADQIECLIPKHSVLIGWSLGGMVATHLAQRNSLAVKGLVTIATSPCFVEKADWELGMPENIFYTFEAALKLDPLKTLQRFMMLQVKGLKDAKAQLTNLKKAMFPSQTENMGATLQLLRVDNRDMLARLNVSVLQLFGERDALVNSKVAEFKINKRVQSIVIPGAGHLPFLSEPELVANHVIGFILFACEEC